MDGLPNLPQYPMHTKCETGNNIVSANENMISDLTLKSFFKGFQNW